ncbi:MAG: hypothetical protein ACM3ZA_10570 [Bacillota bacterium]
MAEGVLYAIRVKGHLDDRWATWFDQVTVTNHENGEAMLHVVIRDQTALHGLLDRIRDLNLYLISVRVEE